jgi:hypothetical protein
MEPKHDQRSRTDETRDDLRQSERALGSVFAYSRRYDVVDRDLFEAIGKFFCEIFFSRIDNARLNFTLGIPRNASG